MNPRKIDLNLIRTFLAVYETGSISDAGRQLNLTQPAISNAINRLNRALDRQLFFRQGRRIQPTHEATNLYQSLVGPYAAINSALAEFHEFDPPSSTRAFSVSLSNYFDHLMPRFALFIEQTAPNLRFERVQYNLERNLRQIENATLDLMLTATDRLPEHLQFSTLRQDRMVMIARGGHPVLRADRKLTRRQIAGLRFASLISAHEEALPAYLFQYELGAVIYIRTPSFTSLMEVVENTDYVAMIPRMVASNSSRFELQQFDLPERSPDINLRLVWPRQYTNDSGHLWLREMVTRAWSRDEPPARRNRPAH